MKMRKLTVCLLLVLLLTLSLAPAVFADVVFSGDDDNLSGEYDATVFLAGANPTSSADVKGILFEAGNTVNTNGSSEYAFVAGNMVTVAGQVEKEAFIGGSNVSFAGDCGRDLLAAGNMLTISGHVGRDLAAYGSNVIISGEIGGNVNLAAEEIVITDSAKIGGTLRYNESAKITAPAAILSGAETYADTTDNSSANASTEEKSASSSPLSGLKSKLFRCVGLLLIAYFLLWLTPLWEKVDERYTGKDFGTYAAAFGIGFAVLAAVPIASIILMITGVGLRPAFVLLLVYAAAMLASPIFLGFFLGSLLWRAALKKQKNYWAELPIGLLIYTVLKLIPYVSFAAGLVAVPLGLGVIARMFGKKKKATALTEVEQA